MDTVSVMASVIGMPIAWLETNGYVNNVRQNTIATQRSTNLDVNERLEIGRYEWRSAGLRDRP